MKSKIFIIWESRKWSLSYLRWRLETAYPDGWKYALLHPIIFFSDMYNFLEWCQKIDSTIDN